MRVIEFRTTTRADVSFVHGFKEGALVGTDAKPVPALRAIEGHEVECYSYLFPFGSDHFEMLPCPVLGEMPGRVALDEAPRYGFTGLEREAGKLFAGSWNGIYRLNGKTREPEAFLSNRYTRYLHRFHVDEERIITALGFNDTIVIMDHEGQVQELLRVDASLRVERVKREEGVDFRFITKPWTGATGFFHFNNVQVIGDEIWLTARNISASLSS